MNKQDLLKLAKVAGLMVWPRKGDDSLWLDESFLMRPWQPHKDIAQAFEVLEGLGKDYILEYKLGTFFCVFGLEVWAKGESMQDAICQAVLKATKGG